MKKGNLWQSSVIHSSISSTQSESGRCTLTMNLPPTEIDAEGPPESGIRRAGFWLSVTLAIVACYPLGYPALRLHPRLVWYDGPFAESVAFVTDQLYRPLFRLENRIPLYGDYVDYWRVRYGHVPPAVLE